nr:MAG TPA: Sec-independent protein translocase protein TatB protein [Caudoviricetes sp.]
MALRTRLLSHFQLICTSIQFCELLVIVIVILLSIGLFIKE